MTDDTAAHRLRALHVLRPGILGRAECSCGADLCYPSEFGDVTEAEAREAFDEHLDDAIELPRGVFCAIADALETAERLAGDHFERVGASPVWRALVATLEALRDALPPVLERIAEPGPLSATDVLATKGWHDVRRRQVQPRVDGKPFRCECGCNVFTRSGNIFQCNACRTKYEGESTSDGETTP